MSVILLILKIIGIFLLCVLGLILFLLVLVLLVPVRYQISGEIEETIKIRGKFHWLLHLLAFYFAYEGDSFVYYLRIFGIRKNFRNNDTNEDGCEEDDECDQEDGYAEDGDSCEKDLCDKDSCDSQEDACDKENAYDEDKTHSGIQSIETDGTTRKVRKNSILRFFDKIKEIWYNIKRTTALLKEIPTHISDIKNIILDETNKKTALLLLAEIKKLLQHFRFRRIKTELSFSLADPALTGQALGILCMIPMLYQYEFHVYPDFVSEQVYLKGTFSIKGRVRVLHLGISLLRLWKERDFRILVHRLLNKK